MSLSRKFDIFNIPNEESFHSIALEVFFFQYQNNRVYREFVEKLGVIQSQVSKLEQIPFLPVEFFKTHQVICGDKSSEMIFTSSGTTGVSTGKHFVKDISIYEDSFCKGFEHFYGSVSDYHIIALLPSYLEREGSSLVYMVDSLIKASNSPFSGFYLNDFDKLFHTLSDAKKTSRKILFIGVTYALLDFAEQFSIDLSGYLVMETGGMKGRRKEMVRAEVHEILKLKFNLTHIHSEYGMTEMLSQAYSLGDGLFQCPPWLKILIRDTEDPLSLMPDAKNGGINVIDLSNWNSCAFLATQDIGKVYNSGNFEVFGRFDHSDVRGCNLLYV